MEAQVTSSNITLIGDELSELRGETAELLHIRVLKLIGLPDNDHGSVSPIRFESYSVGYVVSQFPDSRGRIIEELDAERASPRASHCRGTTIFLF